MVHRIKKQTKVIYEDGRKLLLPETTAKAKKMEWTVTKKGKTYTAHRKKKEWVVGKRKRKDIGAVGVGKKVIKIKRKGALKKFGYGVHKTASERREALRKADKAYGSPAVFKMILAQTVFRKRFPNGAKEAFQSDLEWVKKNLLSETERLAMTRPARKEWMAMSPQARALAMPERT